MAIKNLLFVLVLIFFVMTPFIDAQSVDSSDLRFTRRIIWRGGEHALRYAVEIDRMESGIYRNHIRDFTTMLFYETSLPVGEYRFRIIPHDILDRPGQGTPWLTFEIRHVVRPVVDDPASAIPFVEEEQFQIISIDELISEQAGEQAEDQVIGSGEQAGDQVIGSGEQVADQVIGSEEQGELTEGRLPGDPRFNTVGVSVGSSFSDPLVIVTVHGTYAPMDYFYVKLGFDFGFVSTYDDVESFYSVYPFVNVGAFIPFSGRGGLFAGIGGGYMLGKYVFSYGEADINAWCVNLIAGVNLFDMINVSFTLMTNFDALSVKAAVGYVFRF